MWVTGDPLLTLGLELHVWACVLALMHPTSNYSVTSGLQNAKVVGWQHPSFSLHAPITDTQGGHSTLPRGCSGWPDSPPGAAGCLLLRLPCCSVTSTGTSNPSSLVSIDIATASRPGSAWSQARQERDICRLDGTALLTCPLGPPGQGFWQVAPQEKQSIVNFESDSILGIKGV